MSTTTLYETTPQTGTVSSSNLTTLYSNPTSFTTGVVNSAVYSVTGSTGVTVNPTTGNVVVSIGQDVATTANVQFANIHATGNLSNNYFTLANSVGSNGQVLTTDGAGNTIWTTPSSLGLVTSVSGSGAGISVSPTTGAVVVSNTGVTSIVAGTNISISGATGAVTVNATDTNTTYQIASASATGGANLNLVGSDSTTDSVKFASGSGISVSSTDANTITITNTGIGTTYNIDASTTTGGANLNLTGSDASTDSVAFLGSGSTTVTRTDANTITISSTAGTGDVVGPSGATAQAVAIYNGTTGKLIKNSTVTIADTTGNIVTNGDMAVNGGDLTTTATTATLFNTGATTLNVGQAATTMSIGATTGTTTIRNNLQAGSVNAVGTFGNLLANNGMYVKGAMNVAYTDGTVVDYVTGMGRISVGAADGLTFYNGGVANTALLALDSSGNATLKGNLQLNGSSSGSVTLSAGATPAAQTYTLPNAYPGTSGYVLASTTSGTLSWVSNATIPDGTAKGQLLYWDGTSWTANNVITSAASADRLTAVYQNSTAGDSSAMLVRKDYGATAYSSANNDGVGISYSLTSNSQGISNYGFVGFEYSATDPQFVVANSTNNFASSTQVLLVNSAGAAITGDLDVRGGDITNSTGALQLSTVSNNNITLAPNGTGDIQLQADAVTVGNNSSSGVISSRGAYDLFLQTNNGTNSGSLTLAQGANGNITLAPNGTGNVALTLNNGGNLTNTRNYLFGAVRDTTTLNNGNIFNFQSTISPTRGISLSNSDAPSSYRPGIVLRDYSSASGTAPRSWIVFENARGTVATPTAIQNNDKFAEIMVQGYNGTQWTSDAVLATPFLFRASATENWAASPARAGTKLEVICQPAGVTYTATTPMNIIDHSPTSATYRADTFNIAQRTTAAGGTNQTMFNVSNDGANHIAASVIQSRATSGSEFALTNFTTQRSTDGVNYTPTQSGDIIGQFKFNGNANTGTSPGVPGGPGAQIQATATELWSPTANGTKVDFFAIKNGTILSYNVIGASPDAIALNSTSTAINSYDGLTNYATFNSSGLILPGDLAVNGGDITTSASTFNIATSASTVNIGSNTVNVGRLDIDGRTTSDTAVLTTTSTATQTLISSTRNVSTAQIYIVQGTNVHTVTVTALRVDATTAMCTTYGEMYNNISLAGFSADVSGGNLRILVTPTSTNSTLFSSVRTSLS